MKKLPLFLFVGAIAFLVYALVYLKDGNITIKTAKNKTAKTTKVDKSTKSTKLDKAKRFDKIEVEGAFHVDVTYGSEEKVEIEAPNYIKKRIKVRVRSKTLSFELDKNKSLTSAGKVKVHITTAKLNGFNISGASSIKLNNTLKDDSFTIETSGAASFRGDVKVSSAEIELDGAASMKLTGTADDASLELSGASKLRGFDFKVGTLNVDLSGASSTKLAVSKSITGDVSGASSLEYDGGGDVKGLDVSGAGSARKR